MTIDEADRLRKEWGDKPCEHPNFEKEYYPATKDNGNVQNTTGDWVCTQCGEDLTDEEKRAIEEARKK